MDIPKEYSRAKQNVEYYVYGNFFSVFFLHVNKIVLKDRMRESFRSIR